MTPRTWIALLLTTLVANAGCGSMRSAGAAKMAAAEPTAPAPESVATSASPGSPLPPPSPTAAPAAKTTTDARGAKTVKSTRAPVLIYQGDLKMIADEDAIPKTIDAIVDIAESLGGQLAGRKDASVVVKVPSASFRQALSQIDGVGGVVSRSISTDDVSEEFHDLEVRLANLGATRARLQELLAKTGAIGDMLTVERELERVAMEIDRIQGRLEFLRTHAAMSTIAVQLAPKPKVAPLVTPRSTPPAARAPELPIPWVHDIGVDSLLSLRK